MKFFSCSVNFLACCTRLLIIATSFLLTENPLNSWCINSNDLLLYTNPRSAIVLENILSVYPYNFSSGINKVYFFILMSLHVHIYTSLCHRSFFHKLLLVFSLNLYFIVYSYVKFLCNLCII